MRHSSKAIPPSGCGDDNSSDPVKRSPGESAGTRKHEMPRLRAAGSVDANTL